MPRDIPDLVSTRGRSRVAFARAIAVAAVMGASTPAQAAQPSRGPRASLGIVEKLKSGDPGRIREGLEDARLAGKNASALATEIAGLLDRGLSPGLAESALSVLGELEAPAVAPSIAACLQHREPKVRMAAARALSRTKGPTSVAALRRALSDPDGSVRGAAAAGLGALRAREAVGDLTVALDRRIPEASGPIGQLCNVDQCNAFLGRLGQLPFELMASGIDAMLLRPTTEVNDDAKANVIGRLRELKTTEVHDFLERLQKRWPPAASPRLKTLLDQAVKATAQPSGP